VDLCPSALGILFVRQLVGCSLVIKCHITVRRASQRRASTICADGRTHKNTNRAHASPTAGLEPTTTRLRALRPTYCPRRAVVLMEAGLCEMGTGKYGRARELRLVCPHNGTQTSAVREYRTHDPGITHGQLCCSRAACEPCEEAAPADMHALGSPLSPPCSPAFLAPCFAATPTRP
jgi:hypothetical protein